MQKKNFVSCDMEHEELDHFRQVTVPQDWAQASRLDFDVTKRQPVTHPPFTPSHTGL